MLKVTVKEHSAASPEQVLALAGTDFSAHRAQIWPNVTTRKLEVHERGNAYVDVTEGGTSIARYFWERCRYDWSQPGTVKATVIDSNVVAPGSTFELRVAPHEGGGSEVEMTIVRGFKLSLAGCIASALNHFGGKALFGSMLRSALKAVERASARPAQSDAVQAAARSVMGNARQCSTGSIALELGGSNDIANLWPEP
jgi:hypothetical protein